MREKWKKEKERWRDGYMIFGADYQHRQLLQASKLSSTNFEVGSNPFTRLVFHFSQDTVWLPFYRTNNFSFACIRFHKLMSQRNILPGKHTLDGNLDLTTGNSRQSSLHHLFLD